MPIRLMTIAEFGFFFRFVPPRNCFPIRFACEQDIGMRMMVKK